MHVFRDGGAGQQKGAALESYLHAQLDRAAAAPGEDFFSALTRATFRGGPLTREEMMGFANLTFAGGRDTVIHTISSVLAPSRGASGSTGVSARRSGAHRSCERGIFPRDHAADPHRPGVSGRNQRAWGDGAAAAAGFRSAGRRRTRMPPPSTPRRKSASTANRIPHLAFGFGAHLCLGAAHARLLLRTLLQTCVERVGRLTILEAHDRIEDEERYRRVVGFESLTLAFTGR